MSSPGRRYVFLAPFSWRFGAAPRTGGSFVVCRVDDGPADVNTVLLDAGTLTGTEFWQDALESELRELVDAGGTSASASGWWRARQTSRRGRRLWRTGPYGTGRTGAPLLVGSYERVAGYLDCYVALGVSKLLLTRVDTEDEFAHCAAVLARLGNP